MQNPKIASTLGINQSLIYMLTFGFGCMLTGLAGAILVPIVGAYPTLGLVYIAKSFVTVISGGSLPLLGTITASSLFGTIDGFVATISTSVMEYFLFDLPYKHSGNKNKMIISFNLFI